MIAELMDFRMKNFFVFLSKNCSSNQGVKLRGDLNLLHCPSQQERCTFIFSKLYVERSKVKTPVFSACGVLGMC
jgi:hypothetical protein